MATRPWTSYPYFEDDTSSDVVIARMGDDVTPRMRAVMTSAIRHLHAFVKEARPNHDEWLVAIRFLTATGQMSTDWRQDCILLLDRLGVTMLVEGINHSHGDGRRKTPFCGRSMLKPRRNIRTATASCCSANRVEGMGAEMACKSPARSAKAILGAEMPLGADVLSSVATSMRPPCRMPLPYTAGDLAAQAIAVAEAGVSILHLRARRWGW